MSDKNTNRFKIKVGDQYLVDSPLNNIVDKTLCFSSDINDGGIFSFVDSADYICCIHRCQDVGKYLGEIKLFDALVDDTLVKKWKDVELHPPFEMKKCPFKLFMNGIKVLKKD